MNDRNLKSWYIIIIIYKRLRFNSLFYLRFNSDELSNLKTGRVYVTGNVQYVNKVFFKNPGIFRQSN